MTVRVEIAIDDPAWGDARDLQALVAGTASVIWRRLALPDAPAELSVLFAADDAVRALNTRWRGKDTPTNVLSFPAAPVPRGAPPGAVLGDIVLARETIAREAAIDGKSFDAHLTHLIVHGLLHLLGYDHVKEEDADEMERLERAILAELGIADPYAPVLNT